MVPRAPTPPGERAVCRPDEEAAGALRVLRDHRQYQEPPELPIPRHPSLAQVAQSPLEQGPDAVGAFWRVGGALPAASGSATMHATGHVANSWHEEPGA